MSLRFHQPEQLFELGGLSQCREETITVSGCAFGRGGGMTSDQDRDAALLHRSGKTSDRTKVVVLAVETRRIVSPQRAQCLNRLVSHLASRVKVETQRTELLFQPAAANSEHMRPPDKTSRLATSLAVYKG